MPNQIWCEAGHYVVDKSDMLWTGRRTAEGQECLVEGCSARIVVRHWFDSSSQLGYIIPEETDVHDKINADLLREKARQLRIEADALEEQALAAMLYRIPDVSKDQTMIDPARKLDWHRTRDESLRVPCSDGNVEQQSNE